MVVFPQLRTDGAVHARRHQNAATRAERQVRQAGFTAAVVAVGRVQQLSNAGLQARLQFQCRHNQVAGRQVAHHRGRKIAAARCRIGCDVAANVGQLHRNAQINRMPQCGLIVATQDPAHHRTHRSGGLIAVAKQRSLIGYAHGVQVGSDAFNKAQHQRGLNAAFAHQSDGVGHNRVPRGTTDDFLRDQRQRSAWMASGRLSGVDFVRQIVHIAAKAVEPRGAIGVD